MSTTLTTLITGANSGIGLETAKTLLAQGHRLILTVRDEKKQQATLQALGNPAQEKVAFVFIEDLANLAEVTKAAKEISLIAPRIDRLICNAGYTPSKIEYNAAGYERSFAANHLGHFTLVEALHPMLAKSQDPRVIVVSSAAHMGGKLDRMFEKYGKPSTLLAYCDGKLANLFFARCLARQHGPAQIGQPGLLSFSLHPGVVKTNFAGTSSGIFKVALFLARPFMISARKGAETSIFLATCPRAQVEQVNGSYFEKSKPERARSADISAQNEVLFWQKSQTAVAESMAAM